MQEGVSISLDSFIGSSLLQSKLSVSSFSRPSSNILNREQFLTLFLETLHCKQVIRNFVGSLHGFKSETLHSKCNYLRNIVVVIQSREYSNIFGGFSREHLTEKRTFVKDSNAFLFKFNENGKLERFRIKSKDYCALISWSETHLIEFGSDLSIVENCDLNFHSFSSFCMYESPPGKNNLESNSYLAGSCRFQVEELEVFNVEI